MVHDCEGALRYLVGWVQDCDLVVCYGLCEYDMLCMLYDVLTWVVHGGGLYVSIIIIHGMLNHCMCT